MTALVLRGDARALPLPDASVDLIVTSPPYWKLRSYTDGGEHYLGQIGDEPSPWGYLGALWECTAEWVRVLKPGGSLFVVIGDKYANRTRGAWRGSSDGRTWRGDSPRYTRPKDLPEKSLIGLPWRYAIGCIDQLGLILRSEIVWSKPSPLPESVTDRVRRSHEQIFHFTLQPRYYSAVDEIREPHRAPRRAAGATAFGARDASIARTATGDYDGPNPLGALPGSVWDIAAQPLRVPEELQADHYAAFPPAMVRRMVLGWSPPGICTECEHGRRPIAERKPMEWRESPTIAGRSGDGRSYRPASGTMLAAAETRITGYACACATPDAPTRPAVVLDPFGGTGTTALVASTLGRRGVTIDRSADYCRIATWRTTDPGERARTLGLPKPPPPVAGQDSLLDFFDGVAT